MLVKGACFVGFGPSAANPYPVDICLYPHCLTLQACHEYQAIYLVSNIAKQLEEMEGSGVLGIKSVVHSLNL